MAAETDCMITIRLVSGKSYTIGYAKSAKVIDLKREIAKASEIPVSQQTLLMGGTKLENDKAASEYHLQQMTVVTLVLKASLPTHSPGEEYDYQRVPYEPLATIDMVDIPIPSLGTHQDFYVWCNNSEHVSLHQGVAFPPLPEKLQRANLKIRCKNCKSDWVENFSPPAENWTQMFLSSQESPPVGRCYQCNAKDVQLEYYFLCRGDRVTPNEQGRTVCRGSDPAKTMFLPCLVSNTDQVNSLDSLDPDPVQIQFWPCGHRMNASGLAAFLRSCQPRTCLARNNHFPEILGQYGLRCILPECKSLLCTPSCRVAGDLSYQLIKNWQTKESVLAEGGVICCKCYTTFLIDANHPGPRRTCPNPECRVVFCEQHQELWEQCPHTDTPDKKLRRDIGMAFIEGVFQRCPKKSCREAGQKGSECTHITCHACSTLYCYWCADFLENGWCPRRCPWLLMQVSVTKGDTVAEQLAKFHRLKVLRLLRNVRRPDSTSFDKLFNAIPRQERTISISQEEDKSHHSFSIELEEILASPPRSNLFNRGDKTRETIICHDYP